MQRRRARHLVEIAQPPLGIAAFERGVEVEIGLHRGAVLEIRARRAPAAVRTQVARGAETQRVGRHQAEDVDQVDAQHGVGIRGDRPAMFVYVERERWCDISDAASRMRATITA